MKVKTGMKCKFSRFSKNNREDDYSKCMLDYAIRWADLMEKKIGKSPESPEKVIAESAERLSHEADTEGITELMHGWAVHVLAEFWACGEALRAWHNSQCGVEGSNGVLNPAIFVVGGDQ